jgi:CSLREA domain-containing protein
VRLISRFLVLGLLVVRLSALAPDASAASGNLITVNTPKDLLDSADGRCSLREALNAAAEAAPSGAADGECVAGGSAGEDVIQLKPDTTYKLTRDGDQDDNQNTDGDLDVLGGSVKIRGGKGTTIAQQDIDQRVIDVLTASLALERVAITGGHPQPAGNGGGIRNFGVLTMWKCRVFGNSAGSGIARSGVPGGSGGGIYNANILFLDLSKVMNNAAGDGANGNLSSSEATSGGHGGGIYSTGTLTIEDSKVLNNRAGGGGHGGSSRLAAGGSGADGGDGGAIETSGALAIARSNLAGNRTGDGGNGGNGGQTLSGEGLDGADAGHAGWGGGVHVTSGTMSTFDSTISGNRTGQGGLGGAGGGGSPSGAPGAYGFDGLGGGLTIDGHSTLANVTISGNTADGGGGGIASFDDVGLNNVTIARNAAPEGEGGGVLRSVGGVFALNNTLIADNSAALASDCSGALDAKAYNLVEHPDGCTGLSGTDITGVDPRLSALNRNGGPTKTHALRSGSPAINAGDPNPSPLFGCTANDQRGKPRADCDIGAYER